MLDNRKTRYTRRVIKDSYCELLLKKHISKVTVKELCELADINKGTFYNHYYSIYDLQEELENTIIDKIKEAVEKVVYKTQEETVYVVLSILYEQKDVLYSMIKNSSDSSFWNKLSVILTNTSICLWKDLDISHETIMMATRYILATSEAIQREWIMNGCKESINDIKYIIVNVLKKIEELFFVERS
jgi:AcrR family transcriptional regulator